MRSKPFSRRYIPTVRIPLSALWFRTILLVVSVCAVSQAQNVPDEPGKVWHSKEERGLAGEAAAHPEVPYDINCQQKYTLAELTDLAQKHNPETRVA